MRVYLAGAGSVSGREDERLDEVAAAGTGRGRRRLVDRVRPCARAPVALPVQDEGLDQHRPHAAGTLKRGVDVDFPIHPALANALALAPSHGAPTIAATSRGRPWTESGFNSTFSKLVDELEKAGKVEPGLTLHGLRHTVGTRLIEAGATPDDVQRLLGQRSASMAHHYSKTADISERTAGLVSRMKVIGE